MIKMKSLARTYVWWPLIDKDIERVIQECKRSVASPTDYAGGFASSTIIK